MIYLHDASEHASDPALKHTPDNVPPPDISRVSKHASEGAVHFDIDSVSEPAVGHVPQTAYDRDLKYLAPGDDDTARYTLEQETDRATAQAEQAIAGALGPERQRAEGKVEGFDLECGKRIDDPVRLIKKVGLHDRNARNLVEVFHCSTGQVIDAGLNDELSDEAITNVYTECVHLYQDQVYEYGLETNAVIRDSE